MMLREYLMPPPTMFRSDPQAVEAVTGWFIAFTGLSCWFQEWFGYFMPNPTLHGWEWVVALVLVPIGVRHAVKAHSRNLKKRAMQAYWASGIFAGLAVVLFTNHEIGWRVPGGAYALLGSVVNGWCYLRLKRYIW